MKYLLDTDSLVTPKNSYYPMDLCPRFWDWILESNKGGILFSIQKVKEEVLAGKDDLAEWAKLRGDEFFLPPDQTTFDALAKVNQWVQSNPYYTEANRAAFFSKADSLLVAHALAAGFTVVTFEKGVPSNSSKIKIPSVCAAMGVGSTDILSLLRQFKVKLS